MTKEELRKIYLQKRRSLSSAEYEQLSAEVCENFFNHVDLSSIEFLHIFIPIEKNKEPNTWFIIDRLQKRFPEINVVVPRVNHQTEEMENFIFEGKDQLQMNTWEIPEPKEGKEVKAEQIEMVLIPLVTFDHLGHRVGYGKGFYDKLLGKCKPDCKRIGLSLFEPVEKIDDINPHDKKLQSCITPIKVSNFEP
ncbi:MAG TPA: 5-formyltetrahydrofolate cyclo-ligase [Chryseolinea sp.]|nr:5-formyltetrahydrofolate cyclo-ligase [Chryseolinea sp.]HPM29533.1 5-formyltetrahydrofolate cyclo-ligase [Chryseolinea sp.]